MADVRFRNLDQLPLQAEFTPSSVYKISAASKVAAVVIGIISICVFALTDNAKTAITTISSTNVDGKCTMLASVTAQLVEESVTVSARSANEIVQAYSALMKEVTGHYRQELPIPCESLMDDDTVVRFPQSPALPVVFMQKYYPTYQSCIDEFSKPPVCHFTPATDSKNDRERRECDVPTICRTTNGFNSRLQNSCTSVLKCNWPQVEQPYLIPSYFRVILNGTIFRCAPSVNFTTCDSVSSSCPEFKRFASGFSKIFHLIHPPEQMCQTFKNNPPYSCQSFQVVSPIQVISQTLSLMATTLGGSELLLFAMLKYKHMCTRSHQVVPAVVGKTTDDAP
jgi:hypothetical protein